MVKNSGILLYTLRTHAILGVMLVFSLFLSGLLFLEIVVVGGMPEIDVQPASTEQSFTLLSTQGMRKSKRFFDVIVKRPIFYKDRAPITAVAVKSVSSLADWKVSGVVITPLKRIALFENAKLLKSRDPVQQKKGKVHSALGEKPFGEWRIIEIEKTYIKLQLRNKIERIDVKNELQNVRGRNKRQRSIRQ